MGIHLNYTPFNLIINKRKLKDSHTRSVPGNQQELILGIGKYTTNIVEPNNFLEINKFTENNVCSNKTGHVIADVL